MTIRKCLEAFIRKYSSMRAANPETYETGFHLEFQKLHEEHVQFNQERGQMGCEGRIEHNRKKNRYKDIVPYDETRVKLKTLPGILGSDYVNASYIKGASGHNSYIAAQGPLPSSTADFWRMIWEKNVHVVIMTCKEEEGGKSKCERYWPFRGETKSFYNINIVMESEEKSFHKDYFMRDFKVTCEDETRVVKHFHYTTWPDHAIPDSVTPMLDMIAMVRDYQPGDSTPIVVHCSAGCGRTGTLCAIDYCWSLLKCGKLDSKFNLYDLIADMRKQRAYMVQTRDQYQYVYQAVAELFSSHLEIINQHLYENIELHKRDEKPKEEEEDLLSQEEPAVSVVKITDKDYVNASVLKKMTSASPIMKNSIKETVKLWEKHIKETDSIALRMKSRPRISPKPKTPDTNVFFQDPFNKPKEKISPRLAQKQLVKEEVKLRVNAPPSAIEKIPPMISQKPVAKVASNVETNKPFATKENNHPKFLQKHIQKDESNRNISQETASKEKVSPQIPFKSIISIGSDVDINESGQNFDQITASKEKIPPLIPFKAVINTGSNVEVNKEVTPNLPDFPESSNLYEEIDYNKQSKLQKPFQPLLIDFGTEGKGSPDDDDDPGISSSSSPVAPPRYNRNSSKNKKKKAFIFEHDDLYASIDRKNKQITTTELDITYPDDEQDEMSPAIPVKTKQSFTPVTSNIEHVFGFPKRIGTPRGPRPQPSHWKQFK